MVTDWKRFWVCLAVNLGGSSIALIGVCLIAAVFCRAFGIPVSGRPFLGVGLLTLMYCCRRAWERSGAAP